jgi:GTP-binding protein
VVQTGTCPPQFTFFANHPDMVDDTYRRYLENRLRGSFDLTGTPVRLKFKRKD